MNTEMTIAIAAASISLAGMLTSVFLYRQSRTCRGLLEFTEQQVNELADTASDLHETIEGYKRKTADQSRRIAWLESRLRQPKAAREEVIDDTPAAKPLPWNMTERRHHVLKLASRGQDRDKIAATLGMMPGEVELIINLNRSNFAASMSGTAVHG